MSKITLICYKTRKEIINECPLLKHFVVLGNRYSQYIYICTSIHQWTKKRYNEKNRLSDRKIKEETKEILELILDHYDDKCLDKYVIKIIKIIKSGVDYELNDKDIYFLYTEGKWDMETGDDGEELEGDSIHKPYLTKDMLDRELDEWRDKDDIVQERNKYDIDEVLHGERDLYGSGSGYGWGMYDRYPIRESTEDKYGRCNRRIEEHGKCLIRENTEEQHDRRRMYGRKLIN